MSDPDLPPVRPYQCREGRELLGWSGADLALKAEVQLGALARFEDGSGGLDRDTLGRIRAALEGGGVEFTSDSRGGGAARLKRLQNASEDA